MKSTARAALSLMALLGTTKSKMIEVDARIEPKFDSMRMSLVGDDDDLDVVEKNLKDASDV